jgi:hypothetical protein
MHHIELKIWTRIIWIVNKIEPNSNQSKLGNESITWIKHKEKFKVTHGNLMNLLDLAKSNRADN